MIRTFQAPISAGCGNVKAAVLGLYAFMVIALAVCTSYYAADERADDMPHRASCESIAGVFVAYICWVVLASVLAISTLCTKNALKRTLEGMFKVVAFPIALIGAGISLTVVLSNMDCDEGHTKSLGVIVCLVVLLSFPMYLAASWASGSSDYTQYTESDYEGDDDLELGSFYGGSSHGGSPLKSPKKSPSASPRRHHRRGRSRSRSRGRDSGSDSDSDSGSDDGHHRDSNPPSAPVSESERSDSEDEYTNRPAAEAVAPLISPVSARGATDPVVVAPTVTAATAAGTLNASIASSLPSVSRTASYHSSKASNSPRRVLVAPRSRNHSPDDSSGVGSIDPVSPLTVASSEGPPLVVPVATIAAAPAAGAPAAPTAPAVPKTTATKLGLAPESIAAMNLASQHRSVSASPVEEPPSLSPSDMVESFAVSPSPVSEVSRDMVEVLRGMDHSSTAGAGTGDDERGLSATLTPAVGTDGDEDADSDAADSDDGEEDAASGDENSDEDGSDDDEDGEESDDEDGEESDDDDLNSEFDKPATGAPKKKVSKKKATTGKKDTKKSSKKSSTKGTKGAKATKATKSTKAKAKKSEKTATAAKKKAASKSDKSKTTAKKKATGSKKTTKKK